MPRPNVSEQKRRQIIDAFALCFLEKPYEMITLKEIAAKAQIPAGSIYFYFSAKDEILMSHAKLFWKSFENDFAEICKRIATTPLTLAEFADRFFSYQRNYLDDNSSAICVRYLGLVHLHPELSSMIQKSQTFILQQIAMAINSCQIPCHNPMIFARILYSFVDGISLGELTQGTQDTQTCYNELVHILSHFQP